MRGPTYILGADAQEERFTHRKGDASFPMHAVDSRPWEVGIRASDLAYVGFYEKPLPRFERIPRPISAWCRGGFRSFLLAGPPG